MLLLAVTAIAYQSGAWIYRKSKIPMLQPVLVSAFIVVCFLFFFNVPFSTYREETKILPLFLGPVVVALAVPLYESLRRVQEAMLPIVCTLVIGGGMILLSGFALGQLANLDTQMTYSLLTRSSTAPIALEIAQKIGGDVSLTIIGVIISGVIGSAITPVILDLCDIKDLSIRGFTLGFTSHAFGIARAAEMGVESTAFATIGMGTMACATAIVVPSIFGLG
ncbi:MAG: LrgB family protein [Afipia sp.]|nr:LrgB family protein [Afipia sp.]